MQRRGQPRPVAATAMAPRPHSPAGRSYSSIRLTAQSSESHCSRNQFSLAVCIAAVLVREIVGRRHERRMQTPSLITWLLVWQQRRQWTGTGTETERATDTQSATGHAMRQRAKDGGAAIGVCAGCICCCSGCSGCCVCCDCLTVLRRDADEGRGSGSGARRPSR